MICWTWISPLSCVRPHNSVCVGWYHSGHLGKLNIQTRVDLFLVTVYEAKVMGMTYHETLNMLTSADTTFKIWNLATLPKCITMVGHKPPSHVFWWYLSCQIKPQTTLNPSEVSSLKTSCVFSLWHVLVQQFGPVTSAEACVRSHIVSQGGIHNQKPSAAETSVIYKYNCVRCCSPIQEAHKRKGLGLCTLVPSYMITLQWNLY